MNFRNAFYRYFAIYVCVALIVVTPLCGIARANAAIGIKSLVVGGLVGGAALLAIGALAGPAGAVGSVAAAGTGFSSLMGGAVGGVVGGTGGAMAGFGVLGSVALGLGGMFLGAHFLGPLLAGISPMILVPAALIGGGLLMYGWYNRKKYGTAYDARFNQGILDNSLFNAQYRSANRSESGYNSGSTQSGSFLDRFRSTVDRDRRDDSFWWQQQYVDGKGYVRTNSDIWAQLDRFFNGRNGGDGVNDPSVYGIGYGNTQYMNPYGGVRTDQAGRVTIGSTTVQSTSRTGLAPSAPVSSEKASATGSSEEALEAAKSRRTAAYKQLIEVLKRRQDIKAAPEADHAPALSAPEVLEAIREYREADRVMKELTERLQPREKQ